MMNYQCLTPPTKEAHPSQRVHNGDRIIAVNGLDESIEMMMLGGGVGDSFFKYRLSQYPLSPPKSGWKDDFPFPSGEIF